MKNIAETAYLAAMYRALESERVDALFQDPLARVLAGGKGEMLVEVIGEKDKITNAIAIRTIDRQHQRLFIGCTNQLMSVVDANTGSIKATLPIGKRTDTIAYDPVTKLAFSSNGEGSLTVVHQDSADKFSIVNNVITQPGARTMALDLKTHKLYLDTAKFQAKSTPVVGKERSRPSIIPGTFVILVLGD
ncbi:MAG: YncE family protein [Nostoc sp.]